MVYAIAYDTELKRPGCVLIQAALGGTVPSHLFHDLFPSEVWETKLTDKMRLYQATEEELKQISSLTGANRRGSSG